RNTVVDITNLENGASIRVIVAAALDTPGLLAVLSRNAASFLGLRSNAIGRIRMTQPADPIAFSRFTEGMSAYGEPDYIPGIPPVEKPEYSPPPPSPAAPGSSRAEPAAPPVIDRDGASVIPGESALFGYALEPEWNEFDYLGAAGMPDSNPPPEAAAAVPPEPDKPAPERGDFTLIPADERPPETGAPDFIDPSYVIPGIAAPPLEEGSGYLAGTGLEAPEEIPAPEHSIFDIPVLGALERGKYYIQIGAFSRPELIAPAIGRLHKNYPLAIQNAGGQTPVYRLLLGPLNLGESGAMLQRVKSIGYTDAFVRAAH
ncbi:MAG: SPOR domain-containing protein, partial [Treponema sp.]|nr:SPOR domain-containing protein [Treponema sp.]